MRISAVSDVEVRYFYDYPGRPDGFDLIPAGGERTACSDGKWAEHRFKPILRLIAVKLRTAFDPTVRIRHSSETALQAAAE